MISSMTFCYFDHYDQLMALLAQAIFSFSFCNKKVDIFYEHLVVPTFYSCRVKIEVEIWVRWSPVELENKARLEQG